MSGADFLSEPVISFSVTSISSRWYTLVIFNSWYQIERKLLIRFRSSAFNVFWSQSWAHTLFVCQYLLPHVRSHIVFGSGLLYPLCITDWNLILLDTKFRSRIPTYHLGDIPIMCRYFWAPWSCSPYFGYDSYIPCMFCIQLIWDPKAFVIQLFGC